jgi:hypothetical protein
VDGQPVEIETGDDPRGRIHVTLPPGVHRVEARFEDTPVRRWSDRASLASIALLAVWCIARFRTRAVDSGRT